MRRLARRLRDWADLMDPDNAPRGMSWTFTFERSKGLVLRSDGKGCRLWYIGQEAMEKAHAEADDPLPPFKTVMLDELERAARETGSHP